MTIGQRLFAAVYDRLNGSAERSWLGRRRAELLEDVRGEVVEIGAGTGANLRWYRPGARVVLTEPSAPMRRRLEEHLPAASVPVEVHGAPAESLPFDAGRFDVAIATLVLCTVPDPVAALREVRRVLRPGGELRWLEHGGAAAGRRGAWQRRLDPIWSRVGCGCHLTRDARRAVEAAGFTITHVEEYDPPGIPPVLRPFQEGVARP